MRIMFVCHGNICRSPMAEFIFMNMVYEKRMGCRFSAESRATSTEEIYGDVGNPVYPPAKAELKKHGISCEGKYAIQLKREDYDKYDLFIGMDSANIRNMHRILGGDPKGKIHKLLSFAGSDRDVADPWYSGRFDIAYNDIYDGCKALFDSLANSSFC